MKKLLVPMLTSATSLLIALVLILPGSEAHADITFTNMPMNIVTPPSSTSKTPQTFDFLTPDTSTPPLLNRSSEDASSSNSLSSSSSTTPSQTTASTTSTTIITPVSTAITPEASTTVLASTWQTSPIVHIGEVNTLHAQFISPIATSTVLVDLMLYDENNNKVIDQSFDNSAIPSTLLATSSLNLFPTSTTTRTSTHTSLAATSTSQAQGTTTASTTTPTIPGVFSLDTPQNLTPGTYQWKVGLFTPGWNSLIQWYDNPLSFTVIGTSTQIHPNSLSLAGLWQQSSSVPSGSTNYLSIQLMNTGEGTTTRAVIDLFDSNNKLVAERALDYIWIDTFQIVTEGMTTPTLTPGTYHWSVGIYAPQGKTLYDWYDNVTSFTVNPSK